MRQLKLLSFLILSFCISLISNAQSTETFETETIGSASFTDNSQVFNITAQARGPFDVYNYSSGGWSGSSPDNRFIDNSGSTGTNPQFTISSNGAIPFVLNYFYLFVSNASLNQAVSGSITITGKLAGATVYTATQSTGFVSSLGTNNGFTLINLTSFGTQNNSNKNIDQIVITGSGSFEYLALDAFNWSTACPTLTLNLASQTNVSCNGGINGSATVSASGGSSFTYTWSPSGGNTATASNFSAGTYTCNATNQCGSTASRTVAITQPASALSTSTAVTNVLCFGNSTGSATITASGGTSPYSYLWSTAQTTSVITGLNAGVRTVTVTDANGCTSIKSTTISQPASALATSTAVSNVLCFGNSTGSATVTVSGGAGSYTYLWSSAQTTSVITSLNAGVRTVTVTDANGCTSIKSTNISQPVSALATATAVTNISCFGGANGSATLTASGGTSSYTYLWSTGATTSVITAQSLGTKSYTVTDVNGCTSTGNVVISQPTQISANIGSSPTSCTGNTGSASVTSPAGGAGGYTYSWAPSGGTANTATSLGVGNYTCTVTDANSCSITKTVSVITASGPSLTSLSQTNIACFGNSTGAASVNNATGGTTPYTYNWTPGNPTGDGTTSVSGLTAQVYTCTVTDANGCSAFQTFNITQPISALATSTAVTTVACFGNSTGAATVTASGGTSAYTYLWSTGATTSVIASQTSGVKTVTVTDANGCTSIKSVSISQPASALATATAVTNVGCFGNSTGAATITITGGTSSYSYLWSTGATTSVITSQTSGVKTVTVTDANGCTSIKLVSISQPASALATSTNVTNVLCNGGSTGSATITAVGGTLGYTYLWSTGATTSVITSQNPGTKSYTVTDANGCSTISSINITEPTALNVSSSSSSILCNGGVSTITLSATDGTSPYTGVGTFTANAGTQTYTVSDANGCSTTTSVSVTEPLTLNVSSVASSSAICTGAIATVTVTATDGTSPYTGTGTYTVNSANTYTVIDANGCMATTNVSLTVNPLPTLVAISSSTLLCTGETATLSVTGATTYTWNTTENTPDIAITPTVQTTYTVDGIDANGCSNSTTVTQDVSLCTGIAALIGVEEPLISVYPNPNNGLFIVDLTATSQVIVTNALGQIVLTEIIEPGKNSIDIHNEATGIYFVKVIRDNKQYTFKLIKE